MWRGARGTSRPPAIFAAGLEVPMKRIPKPSRGEQVALFRLSVIGDLLAQELDRGELMRQLEARAQKRYRPPGADRTRTFHAKTLQRWYYLAKKDLAGGLVPVSRARGFAKGLAPEQREILLEMRREHPSASAELLRAEAIRHGVIAADDISLSTLRRLYRLADLARVSLRVADRADDVQRRRWQAHAPGDLWHGDVCHLPLLDEHGDPRRILVHGLLDDASRYALALVPRLQEREIDMLEVFLGALLRHPPPDILYLDNGACYRGDLLQLICKRLGIRLVHAQPYSPEARGKMERFWRSLRQRCADHLPPRSSLHDIAQALWAWLDADYHVRPHAGLLGVTPRKRYLDGVKDRRRPFTPRELAAALEVEVNRKIQKDCTFELDGTTYEVAGRHLAGKTIVVIIDALSNRLLRASWQDQPVRFGVCDPVANRRRPRAPSATETLDVRPAPHAPFDPISALLQKAREANDE